MAFVGKPREERNGEENSVSRYRQEATRAFSRIRDGLVFPFNMPAIVELGTATRFRL